MSVFFFFLEGVGGGLFFEGMGEIMSEIFICFYVWGGGGFCG